MTRLTKDQRRSLERLAEGWRPLQYQMEWKSLERRGLVRVDYGPRDTPDKDKMCVYITDAGRGVVRD